MSTCGFPNIHAGHKRRIAFAMLLAGTVAATPAQAARTPAGTIINNNATATYDLPGGGTDSVTSNTVSLTVDELLDVGVAWTDGGDVERCPGRDRAGADLPGHQCRQWRRGLPADRARQWRRRRFRSERDLDRAR